MLFLRVGKSWTTGGDFAKGRLQSIGMGSDARNFVLFKTDLFVFNQRDEDIDKWCVGATVLAGSTFAY